MTEEEYRRRFAEDDAVGWDCIDAALQALYGSREPRHYGTIIKYMLGGEDPLDGISIYDNTAQTFHRHMISYGMSDLYFSPESVENAFSGWGFEFTARVVPFADDPASENNANEPFWMTHVMNNLARYVFESEKWFEPYHFINCNGPIRLDTDTDITGILFVPDPELPAIETPHGAVQFLQIVGMTETERQWLWQDPTLERAERLADMLRKDNPLLIMDLLRKTSVV